MAKSKGKSSRKKGGQVEEVVQCPHLHFKTDVVDRNVLSKEQHLNLLSTPKGYRWEEYKKEGGDGGPDEELSSSRRILCSGRRMKKAEKVYVHNFLAEVWNLLTPEMVDRLKGMLMNEFGMSPQEADDFICKQREENIVNSSTVSFYKKPRDIGDGKFVYDHVVKMRNPNKAHCDKIPKSNLGIRNTWIKDFSDSLSDMMSSYVLDTMCAERTDRQQEIAQTLLKRFNSLLEQNASMSDPKNPVDKTLVLVADRLATWLDNNVGVSKGAAQQIKIMEEVEQRKNMEEDRKRKREQMKKERERREAEEEAQRLADEQAQKLADEQAQKLADEQAQKLADEQAQKLSGEDQDKKLADEEQAQKLAEEEKTQKLAEGVEKEKSPGGREETTTENVQGEPAVEQSEGPAAERKEEGEAQKAEEEQLKKESEEAKPDDAEVREQDEQREKEKDEEATAVAAEQQKVLDELKQKEEEEKAAAAAAEEAEKLKAEEEQKKTEEEAVKAEEQGVEEEQKKAEQEAAETEKQRAKDEKDKAEQEIAEAEKQKTEEDRIKEEKEAAELADMEKQKTEEEQEKKLEEVEAEPKKASEESADEKPVAGLSEQPLRPSDVPVEDVPPSETTESEPPVSDVEDEPAVGPPSEKGDELEPITRVEEIPVDKITPEVAGRVKSGLSPEEKEKRTNEVLKSVASIILETKVDSSPRQGALKDIMEKQLEENLGDQDKEAIGKVSSKIGTWIDKMVDQATLEYGEREPSRPPPGPDDVWAPASSRAQPPSSVPSGMKAPGLVPGVSRAPKEPGWFPGVTGPTQPGWVPGVTGAPTQPGSVPGVTASPTQPGLVPEVTGQPTQPGWVPGVSQALGQQGGVPGFGRTPEEPGWLPGISGAQDSVSPGMRVPIAQRPKGRIYHVSRTGSAFDVNVISNTRAQEKIRLARGKSPAYHNVPNPDAPMGPSDLKKWYHWTSALGEVAESWAEWIKDTIKGTQQRGEDMVRDNSPQRLSEWREFRDNRAQIARNWQQTKKEMELRAEMWSKKGRSVQSQ